MTTSFRKYFLMGIFFSLAAQFVSIRLASAQVSLGECDDGNPCTVDACVSGGPATGGGTGVVCTRCTHTPGNAGTTCRPAAGPCDVAEKCTGSSASCPTPDRFSSWRTVCRPSLGFCDPEERCTGSSASCPSDFRYGSTIVCRVAAGLCDVTEYCDGSSASCSADILKSAGTPCRGRRDLCDVAETCTGSSASCPTDGFSPAGTPCRAALGECDLPGTCTGSSRSCPVGVGRVQPAGTSCSSDGNPCTDDHCDGRTTTCRHVNNSSSCSDGNACTTGDICSRGRCRGGAPITCPLPDQCHDAGTCNPATGTCSTPPSADGRSCSDGNSCNGEETCRGGACTAGTPRTCDDGNSCTTDSCGPKFGCVHATISLCANGDGCCPSSCNAGNDNDCPARCGDGVVSSEEECDDGNTDNTDSCRNDCTRTPTRCTMVCGDGVINTIAGDGREYGGSGGTPLTTSLYRPIDLAFEPSSGHLFILNAGGGGGLRGTISEFVPGIPGGGGDTISTILGTGTVIGCAPGDSACAVGDGGPISNAWLRIPAGLTFDTTGNLYISDSDLCKIWKVDTSDIAHIIAGRHFGTGPEMCWSVGDFGDGGPAVDAYLYGPGGIAADASGNIYFPDGAGIPGIREIDTSGIITTTAGGGRCGSSVCGPDSLGDGGPAIGAILGGADVAFDPSGDLYIADFGTDRIRKVKRATGIISTVAGSIITPPRGTSDPVPVTFGGDGGPATAAQLYRPISITFDDCGNLFISDWGNNRIRKVDPSGIISTVVGNGTRGFSGDGGSATAAAINQPHGLVVHLSEDGSEEELFFADLGNMRVRKVVFSCSDTTGSP